jgi:hypothetical protein
MPPRFLFSTSSSSSLPSSLPSSPLTLIDLGSSISLPELSLFLEGGREGGRVYVVAPGSVSWELQPLLEDKGMKKMFSFWPHLSIEDWPGREGGREGWSVVVWGKEEVGKEGREGGREEL